MLEMTAEEIIAAGQSFGALRGTPALAFLHTLLDNFEREAGQAVLDDPTVTREWGVGFRSAIRSVRDNLLKVEEQAKVLEEAGKKRRSALSLPSMGSGPLTGGVE